MNLVAEAEAFLEGLKSEPAAAEPSHAELAAAPADQPLSAVPEQHSNGAGPASAIKAEPEQDGTTPGRRKRNRWGPSQGEKQENGVKAEGETEGKPGGKKRRSRWETVPETNTDTTLATIIPKEIVIAGGIKVCTYAGSPSSAARPAGPLDGKPHTVVLVSQH